ncbi:carbon-nitrogen hydrolase family protein [Rhizobium bangladeshense]|uniref:Carbon-nitrogen hydrolase family protein n=1 Tax=Rhizobium bangladeshense TaxID=1138189 RepID=A0ABS7LF10_9HYPH|nr:MULTISPECIES: carbon-nitrogen hydrolase family protein [Rhizobium]MBX4865934.1 carbon-nitrogen hydrolase family protein [Rhizobium bangladeshense]MBX4872178.1 carbon-nitrogen hydrolase family protein [Rhizobium bangladeshense]MBX4882514.1 carbon-nitrogen hydrolase family protein [Rhizobium bangladeshense]MBX4896055.1 carbon-nitrogen hydrolase family protein [Rhizobium bangladeshense]MBX4903048.1 carbon-nitrogen hydrolase family protein [Rhizobium bangladeshense]
MTENGNLKRRVRARAAKTGESYTTALMHIRRAPTQERKPDVRRLRMAVAQTIYMDDPRDIDRLRQGGQEIRRQMRQARESGARLVHFPEGTICAPNKRIMSEVGPREIGASDWRRFEWGVLREELDATRSLARELGLWAVIGSAHQLTAPHRPHSSLYVVSDRGELVTRYDERLLSNTKISFMYTPGSIPVTFEVDGIRFGCSLGMECHFPEIFSEYERLDAHCVLFSTTGGVPANDAAFAAEAQGHASTNRYWVSFSLSTHPGLADPAVSGIVAPGGRWAAQCQADGMPAIALADIDDNPGDLSRPWRRKARSGLYEPHRVEGDPRSDARDMF